MLRLPAGRGLLRYRHFPEDCRAAWQAPNRRDRWMESVWRKCPSGSHFPDKAGGNDAGACSRPKIGIRRSGKMVDLTDVVGQIFDESLCVSGHCIALQNDEMLAEIVPHPSCFFGIFDHILIIRLLQFELAGCLLQLLLRFKPLLLSGENLKEYKIDHKRTQDQSDVKIQDGPGVNSSVRHREKIQISVSEREQVRADRAGGILLDPENRRAE